MSNDTSPAAPWPSALPSAVPNPNQLTDVLKNGMIPLSIFSLCSALSTSALLVWITWRLIFRSDYQAFSGYNQYVILIYNLLLADLQQALSFIITLHWLDIGQIESPSKTCFTQGFLLNMGDVSSGFFVFAIAMHTWYSVVLGRKVKYSYFTAGILSIWTFAFLLTVIGPATKGSHFYAKTNAWCWVSPKYDLWRLWVHYIWVFIVEFGTIVIYAHIFLHLRKRLRSIRSVATHDPSAPVRTARLSQAARYMVLYPVIYVLLTLPLATGRMVTMSGKAMPISFYCVAGSFLTSCGWLDTLLYTLTRRVFVKPETTATVTHQTRPVTAATSKSHGSAKRWLRGRNHDEAANMPLPDLDDSNWHLSTFASMTGDMNDYGMAKNPLSSITGRTVEITASSRSSSPGSTDPRKHFSNTANNKRDSSPIRNFISSYVPMGAPRSSSRSRSRCGTPTTTTASRLGKNIPLTETTITSNPADSPQMNNTVTDMSGTFNFDFDFGPNATAPVRLPQHGAGILSETKIEVVSVLRDDLLGGQGLAGLLPGNSSKDKLSSMPPAAAAAATATADDGSSSSGGGGNKEKPERSKSRNDKWG